MGGPRSVKLAGYLFGRARDESFAQQIHLPLPHPLIAIHACMSAARSLSSLKTGVGPHPPSLPDRA
jgi:hypothetical protein